MLKNGKKIFFILTMAVFFIFVYYRWDNDRINNSSYKTTKFHDVKHQKRRPANEQTNVKKNIVDDAQSSLTQESPEMNISKNDPIQKVLTRYGINSKNQLKVNHDTWFKSAKYVQVHISEYVEGMGRLMESHNNFKVVELVGGNFNPDNYPPLVVSHATNLPIPITGDLLVKFQQTEDLDQLVNFLEQDSELQQWIQNVVVTPELKDIRWILIKLKKKSEVLDFYNILTKFVGQHNIEAVQPDNRPQLKF